MLSKITRVHKTHTTNQKQQKKLKKQTNRQIYTHKQANQATKIQKDCSIFDSHIKRVMWISSKIATTTIDKKRSNGGNNNEARLMKWKLGDNFNYQTCHVPSISMGKFKHTHTGVRARQTDKQIMRSSDQDGETVKQRERNRDEIQISNTILCTSLSHPVRLLSKHNINS